MALRFADKQEVLYNENIHGLQFLFEYKQHDGQFYDNESIHQWLDKS